MSPPSSLDISLQAFTQRIRCLDHSGLRQKTYTELVARNFSVTLQQAFPVLYSTISSHDWQNTINAYMATAKINSPFLADLAAYFVRYLTTQSTDGKCPLYWAELAHYEWLELDLLFDPLPSMTTTQQQITLDTPLTLAAPIRLPCYHLPVHLIGPSCVPPTDFLPTIEKNHYYLLYRAANSDKIIFLLINHLTQRVLASVQQQAGIKPIDILATLPELNARDKTIHSSLTDLLNKPAFNAIFS